MHMQDGAFLSCMRSSAGDQHHPIRMANQFGGDRGSNGLLSRLSVSSVGRQQWIGLEHPT